MSSMRSQRRYSSLPILSWLENEMRRARSAAARTRARLKQVGAAPDLADDDTALTAGDALRATELEAAQSEFGAPTMNEPLAVESDQPCTPVHREALEQLSIDDLRELAFSLQVPDRSTIIEKAALIDEICKRL